MLRLVHLHDGVRADRHRERIESHYRPVRFESEKEYARHDRDEREESDVPFRADRFFDRFSEIQKKKRVAEEMQETVVDERSDEKACQNIRQRIREGDGSNAVGREFGLRDRQDGSNRSGDQKRVIEAFPLHGF